MSEDLSETIQDAAATPASVTVDGVQTAFRPLPELIEADKYLRDKTAAAARRTRFSFCKINPPGMAD
jgi:hypothetical protein